MFEAVTTTDHDELRAWIEARGCRLAKAETKRDGGILRVDLAEPDGRLDEIHWDEFFEIFEDSQLAFLHQDETKDCGESGFNKFVSRGD